MHWSVEYRFVITIPNRYRHCKRSWLSIFNDEPVDQPLTIASFDPKELYILQKILPVTTIATTQKGVEKALQKEEILYLFSQQLLPFSWMEDHTQCNKLILVCP